MSRYQFLILVTIAASTGDAFISPRQPLFAAAKPFLSHRGTSRPQIAIRGGTTAPESVSAEKEQDTIAKKKVGEGRSVHLQLNSPTMVASMRPSKNEENIAAENKDKDDDDDTNNNGKKPPKPKLIKFRTYRDPAANLTIYGLGIPLRKFRQYIDYQYATAAADHQYTTDADAAAATSTSFDHKHIITEKVSLDEPTTRERMRELWRHEHLISDRTEFLAVYQSERSNGDESNDSDVLPDDDNADTEQKRKRGDFADLLSMYADRLISIIQDEAEEDAASEEKARRIRDMMQRNMTEAAEMERRLVDGSSGGLIGYLKREYGDIEMEELRAESLLKRDREEQYAKLQQFLDWFRDRFPYYYDRCDACGASAKDDGLLDPCNQSSEDDDSASSDASKDGKDDGSTFVGYVYPSEDERQGKAGRTEIYCCHRCEHISRFPRYNSAASVMTSQRGRCGEYSMLMLRFFRALGYEARWVVDWSDHVWAEVQLGDRWVHVDPCEAAIDQPLLYESWGKQQTYIIAFHPSKSTDNDAATKKGESICIEDVTQMYTSDNSTVIEERRDEPNELVISSLSKTKESLQAKLDHVLN